MPRLIALVALAIGLCSFGFGPPAIADTDAQQVPLYPSQVTAMPAVRPPAVEGEAWALIDASSGEMVAGVNAHERLRPASTTKIATAIVALEQGRLDDVVRVDVDSRQMADDSVMGLVPGEVLTLRDLLYGLMLPSGNDAALAIARHVGGSEQRFVALMNAKAAELGLRDTHFVNPHGRDADDHYVSAYDLARLGRYAMQNPEFVAIVTARTYKAEGAIKTYELQNHNPLFDRYEGVDGIKTGYDDAAGQTYVASATRAGHRVVLSLLRSPDRLADAVPLLDYFFETYVWRTVDLPANAAYSLSGPDGKAQVLRLRSAQEVCVPTWQLPLLRLQVWLDDAALRQPAADNPRLGFAGLYLGTRLLAEVPVYGH
ncbi:MAG: D-alanyl-D-alanine carboxypeptidase [Chloroflexi bacterium]|nr:D-alanyl-D-alanine carboxypeptidase [Chloroflexota bacterium]MCL5107701.1 D-alanyl-D-alanine carboxypeptidase [Chloroflexota bacterium]